MVPTADPTPRPVITAVDGSTQRAVARDTAVATDRAWSTPPWLADQRPQVEEARAPSDPVPPPEPAPVTHVVDDDPPGRGVEDADLRMERIRASAHSLKDAIRAEAEQVVRPEPRAAEPPPREPPPREHARAREPAPARDVRARASTSGMFEVEPGAPQAADERDLERAFLGDDDLDDDHREDSSAGSMSGFDAAMATRPIPWKPILLGAGAIVTFVLVAFGDRLFASGDDAETEAKADVSDPAVVPAKTETPPAKEEPAKEEPAKAAPAPTGPATPPGTETPPGTTPPATAPGTTPPATAPGTTPPATAPGTTPPAAGDVESKVAQAKDLYAKAKGGGRKKKLGEAGKLLDEVLATQPKHPEALLILAQVQLELGDVKNALATANRCVEASADKADCWLTIGVLEQENGNKPRAVEAYDKYLALAPTGQYAGEVKRQVGRLRK